MPAPHDFLDDEARRLRSEPGALGAVVERAKRRRRTRRLVTGTVALILAAGGIGLTYAAFVPGMPTRPGVGPVPGPTPTASPWVITGLIISNQSDTEGAAEFAAALLAGERVVTEATQLGGGEGSRETTAIYCHPNREAEAIELRNRFFPGADLFPRITEDQIEVRIGDDFVRGHRHLFNLYITARSFMTRRVEGSGAEAFLPADVAEEYEREGSGLSLYAYTMGGAFRITALVPWEYGHVWAEVDIVTPESGEVIASERILLFNVDPADRSGEILDVEAVRPPDPGVEQIRIFVRQFLRARRHASGAGAFLGEDARDAYASNEDGLDLLRYATSDDLLGTHIVGFDKLSPERSLVRVQFSLP